MLIYYNLSNRFMFLSFLRELRNVRAVIRFCTSIRIQSTV